MYLLFINSEVSPHTVDSQPAMSNHYPDISNTWDKPDHTEYTEPEPKTKNSLLPESHIHHLYSQADEAVMQFVCLLFL